MKVQLTIVIKYVELNLLLKQFNHQKIDNVYILTS